MKFKLFLMILIATFLWKDPATAGTMYQLAGIVADAVDKSGCAAAPGYALSFFGILGATIAKIIYAGYTLFV